MKKKPTKKMLSSYPETLFDLVLKNRYLFEKLVIDETSPWRIKSFSRDCQISLILEYFDFTV